MFNIWLQQNWLIEFVLYHYKSVENYIINVTSITTFKNLWNEIYSGD